MKGRRFDQSCSRTFPYHPLCFLSPFQTVVWIPPPPLNFYPEGLGCCCLMSVNCLGNTPQVGEIPCTGSAEYHALAVRYTMEALTVGIPCTDGNCYTACDDCVLYLAMHFPCVTWCSEDTVLYTVHVPVIWQSLSVWCIIIVRCVLSTPWSVHLVYHALSMWSIMSFPSDISYSIPKPREWWLI